MNEYLLPIYGNAKSRATAAEWEHFIKAASASGFFDGGSEVGKRMIVGDQMSAWSTNHIVGYLRLVADDRLKLLHVWKHTRSCGMAVRWNYVNCPSRDRPAVCGGKVGNAVPPAAKHPSGESRHQLRNCHRLPSRLISLIFRVDSGKTFLLGSPSVGESRRWNHGTTASLA